MRNAIFALVATASVALQPVLVSAQESTTRGFNLGLHFTGASLSVEEEDRNEAGGGGLTVGYGLNRNVMLLLQIDGARFDEQSTGTVTGDWTMGHVDLGVRYHFANSLRSWVPYLQAALTYRAISVSDPIFQDSPVDEIEISGGGLTLGGGIDIYFTETLALDAQFLWTGGEFSTIRIDNTSRSGFDFDATSARFNLGVSWWP